MQDKERTPRALLPATGEANAQKAPSYWTRMATAYTTVYRALLLVLPLFAVLFVITCSRAFSYDSIFCFAKDLQSAASFVPSDYQTVYYTYTEGESQTLSYRGGIANVGAGGIEVYSPDGERLLDVSAEWHSPGAAASHKYLVAYDFGSTEYTVTNAYARLYSGKTEFPILGACVADTGHFALITSSDQHLSQVLLYDANFNLIQRFGRASATTAVSVSDNGRYVAISGISSEEGRAQSIVEVYRIGTETPVFEAKFACELSLALSFTDNRHVALLTDTALRVLNMNGEWEDAVFFDGALPVAYEFGEEGCILALQTDPLTAENRVVVLDKRGDPRYDGMLGGDIKAVSLAEERAFVLFEQVLCGITIADGSVLNSEIAPGACDMFVIDAARVRIVYDDKAMYMYFDEI